jgi:hypothetical protein
MNLYLQARARDLLDHVQIRTACEAVLRHYEAAGVGWRICGWFKAGISAGAEVAKEPHFHVTYMSPDRVLADAPRYVCPAAPAVVEVALNLAFPVARAPPNAAAAPNVGGGNIQGGGGNGQGGGGNGQGGGGNGQGGGGNGQGGGGNGQGGGGNGQAGGGNGQAGGANGQGGGGNDQ